MVLGRLTIDQEYQGNKLGDTIFGATYREQGGQVAAGARYGC